MSRYAVITGASAGLGVEFAKRLSKKGYKLILVARREERLKKLAAHLKTECEVISADLGKEEECHRVWEQIKDKEIEIFVNNAGFGGCGSFVESDLERELNMVQVNVKAVHLFTKLALRKMQKKDKGYILNVASSAGFMAGPKLSTYYSTKNYVLRQSLAIYEELRHMKSNVKISVLCPGPVETNFNNVAGGSFNTKSASSEYVAKLAIDKMFKNKLIIVPTIKIKLAIFLTRLVPTKLLLKINYHIQNTKIKKYNEN